MDDSMKEKKELAPEEKLEEVQAEEAGAAEEKPEEVQAEEAEAA